MNNANFEFKPIDVEGEETLKAIAAADKFNGWMFDTIAPFCKGSVLEVGSGIGNISNFFLENNYDITLSDIRENYCETLQSKFCHFKNCKGVINLDLVDPAFDSKYSSLIGSFDTVFALNVVEHIKDDKLAIANCKKLLKTSGHVIILVPAYNTLYCDLDKELEHYRRYTKKTLRNIITSSFTLMHEQYFNAMGIAGWIYSGKILKIKVIPTKQMKIYNAFVPLFKLIDALLFHKLGLSVIAVGKND
jgi:2-polyprenyl-3-methyl-5-hydroxy-6-metoxy-1,4-benzoquinol methylase